MRCPDCNKFVSYDDEPEVDFGSEPEVEMGNIVGEVNIQVNCADWYRDWETK